MSEQEVYYHFGRMTGQVNFFLGNPIDLTGILPKGMVEVHKIYGEPVERVSGNTYRIKNPRTWDELRGKRR